MNLRHCSSCDSALRKVFARGVELDWCAFCGALHFDRGELAQVLRREVPLTRTGEVQGACAACGGELTCGKVGPLPARACGACDGVFLEAGALDELAGGKVGLLQMPPDRPRESVTFRCLRCGAEGPIEEGHATGRGLVCGSCEAFYQPDLGGSGVLPNIDRLNDPGLGSITDDLIDTGAGEVVAGLIRFVSTMFQFLG
jgi:Zn-finger nucleic acid-binding protein